MKRLLPVSVSASLNAKEATAEQLLQACVDRNVTELCELLLARWPDLKPAYFVWAAGFGKEALVEQLLAEGMPIDVRDSMGRCGVCVCWEWCRNLRPRCAVWVQRAQRQPVQRTGQCRLHGGARSSTRPVTSRCSGGRLAGRPDGWSSPSPATHSS